MATLARLPLEPTPAFASDDQRQILTILRALAVTVEDLRDEVRDAVARERRDDRRLHGELLEIARAIKGNPGAMEASLVRLEAITGELDAAAGTPAPAKT
jgi:hypothetical protein